jgi:Family of unknown function (DUF5318)
MATPRHSSGPRGSRVVAASTKSRPEALPEPEIVTDPTRPRQIVNYFMQRRAALRGLVRTGLREDLCDADPMLLRTAKYHGEDSERLCPVCKKRNLSLVTYTFGAEMGELSGRVRSSTDLKSLAFEYGAFRVYVVEVCQRCAWNHLVVSYVLGDGHPRSAAGRRKSQ